MSDNSIDLRLDNLAVLAREKRIECLREDMHIAELHLTNGTGSVKRLSQTWKCSVQRINILARAYREIGLDAIDCEVSQDILSAVMESAEATSRNAAEVLEDAIARGLSSRQIRDEADIAKGRHTASTPWATGNVDVVAVDGPDVTLRFADEPSGEKPTRASVVIRPILTE